METLTVDLLREYFTYDPETGEVKWRHRFHNRINPSLGIGTNSKGYRSVYFHGKNHPAHRIAWALYHGEFPSQQIDHINGDRTDNRIANLRDVSSAENQKNTKLDKRNKSGVSGVRFRADRSNWEASIRVDGKLIQLGRFASYFHAVQARKSAEARYGFHANHGRAA